MSESAFVLVNDHLTSAIDGIFIYGDISYESPPTPPVPPAPSGGGWSNGGGGGGFTSGPSLYSFSKQHARRRSGLVPAGVGGSEEDDGHYRKFAQESARRIQDEVERLTKEYKDPLRTAREIPRERIREADLRRLRTRIGELEAEVSRLSAEKEEVVRLRATIAELQEVLRTLLERAAEAIKINYRPRFVQKTSPAATAEETVTAMMQDDVEESVKSAVLSSLLGEQIDRRVRTALVPDPVREIGTGLALGAVALGVWAATYKLVPEDSPGFRKVGYGLAWTFCALAIKKIFV